jgi:hypothetical protein
MNIGAPRLASFALVFVGLAGFAVGTSHANITSSNPSTEVPFNISVASNLTNLPTASPSSEVFDPVKSIAGFNTYDRVFSGTSYLDPVTTLPQIGVEGKVDVFWVTPQTKTTTQHDYQRASIGYGYTNGALPNTVSSSQKVLEISGSVSRKADQPALSGVDAYLSFNFGVAGSYQLVGPNTSIIPRLAMLDMVVNGAPLSPVSYNEELTPESNDTGDYRLYRSSGSYSSAFTNGLSFVARMLVGVDVDAQTAVDSAWFNLGLSQDSYVTIASVDTRSRVLLDSISIPALVAPVPEPETYLMMFMGLGLLGVKIRRRNSAVKKAVGCVSTQAQRERT